MGSTNIVSEMLMLYNLQSQMLISTCAAECMRDHLHECTEFVADLHTLTKIKVDFDQFVNIRVTTVSVFPSLYLSLHIPILQLKFMQEIFQNNMKGGSSSLNEDTLGNQLKSGIAQFVALEITRGNGRDNRAISRYLPWLYHPPSTVQQG